MIRREYPRYFLLILPAALIFTTFFFVPMTRLAVVGATGDEGAASYLSIIQTPRHFESMVATVLLSIGVTAFALVISTIAGLFLVRNRFRGSETLVSLLTFPLAFPGVVIGFMIILLAGRQGLIGGISNYLIGYKVVLAYSRGTFLDIYISRYLVILTIMAAAESSPP